MTTLRDALEGAFEAAETGTLDAVGDAPAIETSDPPDPSGETSETAPRTRDESGRFASKVEETEAAAEVEAKPQRKAPSSWKKDYWGQWDKLATDPELAPLQDYIEQREGEFAKGVSTYREEAMKAKDLQDAITPFLPILNEHGLSPAGHVKALMSTHQMLVQGSAEQKAQIFRQLATTYGIPMQAVASGEVDPQQLHTLQELQTLRQTVGQLQMTQQQREQMETQAQIDAFKPNAPHFEEVRETMVGLLQTGHANDLKTAYDKACRLNDNVWAKVQSEQTASSQREAAQRAQAKKAAAVSTRSSAPTGQKVAVNGNDIRSTLESAFDAHSGGRL